MIMLFVILGAYILIQLVSANPLMQSIQSCPVTNYQQNVYRQPYSEAYVLQPSNVNPYSQQFMIQNPVSTYQPLQVPSIMEQINQIYWDKLLSNPTVRNILDSNIIFDPNVNDIQTNPLNPYYKGVVNNYIIVPPEYIKINETTQQKPKVNRLKNDFNYPRKEIVTNQRKKKVLDNDVDKKYTLPNSIKPRKSQQNIHSTWDLNENIKCYTPAEVLEEGNKNPAYYQNKDARKKKNKEKTKKFAKSKNDSEIKVETKKNKPRKSKKNKVKKELTEDGNYKEKTENIIAKTTKKNLKHEKEIEDDCECEEKPVKFMIQEKSKIRETAPQNCDQDIDDVFNLKQDCTDLENRCTRNSRNDPAKDFRNPYPELPDDVSKSFASYMNDLFSNSQVPNSNLFYGNSMYPFDLNQIYQVPQYPNADVAKPQGNKNKSKNNKRKKKQKKKNSNKKKKEENSNSNDENTSTTKKPEVRVKKRPQKVEVTTKSPKIVETTTSVATNTSTTTEKSATTAEILDAEEYTDLEKELKMFKESIFHVEETQSLKPNDVKEKNIVIPHVEETQTLKATDIKERVINIPHIDETRNLKANDLKERIISTPHVEEIHTLRANDLKERIISFPHVDGTQTLKANDLKEKINSIPHVGLTQNLKANDIKEKLITTGKPEEIIKIKEIYETQIPDDVNGIKTDDIDELGKEEIYEEHSYEFDKVHDFGFIDEVPHLSHNRIMDDYYPDFTADNHAYLISEEEIDVRNIHDRYFYTTNKNIDSKESFSNSPHKRTNISKNKQYGVDFDNDHIDYTDNKRRVKQKDEDIVFKTPPGLDGPGFITRKINRNKEDSNEVYYQHRSDDFDKFNFDDFPDRSDYSFKTEKYDNDIKDNTGSVVETVYARSKVVKYGQDQNLEKSMIEKQDTLNSEGESNKDGDKTIVIAKSLIPEDIWQFS